VELSVVVGNPKPQSRTLAVAQAVAARISGGSEVSRVVDLCDYAQDLFTWPNDEVAALNDSVAASDAVVFASPTYKAAYTGLLKAFLDRYPSNGLDGTVAVADRRVGASRNGGRHGAASRPR
jgi:FMN reductase